MSKEETTVNKQASALGKLGGSKNTPAQRAARTRKKSNAGRPTNWASNPILDGNWRGKVRELLRNKRTTEAIRLYQAATQCETIEAVKACCRMQNQK